MIKALWARTTQSFSSNVALNSLVNRLPKGVSGNLALMGATAFVWLCLVFLDFGLRIEALPWGIVSLEIPASSEHAWDAIGAWTYAQQRSALASIALDYVFIVCYTLVLCRWGWWLKKSGRTLLRGKLSVWISGSVNVMFTLAVIAALCDVMENIGLKAMIESAEDPAVIQAAAKGYLVHTAFFHAYLITKSCAIVKFVCLGVLICLGASSSLWYGLANNGGRFLSPE